MYWVFGVVVGALVAFIVLFSAYLAWKIVYPPYMYAQSGVPLTPQGRAPSWGDKVTDPKHDFGLEYEDVDFPAVDGATLRGWLLDARPSKGGPKCSNGDEGGAAGDGGGSSEKHAHGGFNGTVAREDMIVVFVHGGGRDRRAFLRHTPMMIESAEISCLLYDARGHGSSDQDHVGLSYGIREHEDVLSAVEFVKSRGFKAVTLFGTSVGAYSSILAAAKLEADPVLVRGVIAENPFLSIRQQISSIVLNLAFKEVLCRHNLTALWLMTPIRKVVDPLCWWLVARNLGKAVHIPTNDASKVVHLIKRPMLFMHGTKDHVMHHWHSEALYEATHAKKDIWLAKDADHTALFNVHPDEYERRVLAFIFARMGEYEVESSK